MNRILTMLGLLLSVGWTSGCGTAPPVPRIDAYLGAEARPADSMHLPTPGTPVALFVIENMEESAMAPPLSPGGLEFVAQRLRERFEEAAAVTVAKVVPRDAAGESGQRPLPLSSLAEALRVNWVAMVVLSRLEVETAQPLPLDGPPGGGGAMGRLPGTITSVFALAELALVEASSGRTAARSQGRSVATLEELANGLLSNAFPVIYRESGQQRVAAPRDPAEARDALRSLAFDEAAAAAIYEFWSVRKPRASP